MKLPEFNCNTLNIFTDASITTTQLGEYVSCSGAVATVEGNIIDEIFQINRNSTNNNGEIIAIVKGIELALKYRSQFSSINLFSDSKICIYGLREWIVNWVNNSSGSVLIGSQNTPVSNQDIIVECINLILNNNLQIALYHQKGHATDKNLQKALQTFKTSNMIEEFISNEFIQTINRLNDYVDMKSRDILLQQEYNFRITPQTNLVQYVYDPNMDITRYLGLVRN